VLGPTLVYAATFRTRYLCLQDWEDEQLPPVFEGLLQQGNAAGAAGGNGAAGNAAGAPEDPLGGLLGAILAPQGGFHANNQHGHNNGANNNGGNNNDGANAAADGAGAAAGAGPAFDPVDDAAADAVLDQLLHELQQDQQQLEQPPQQQQQQQQAEGPAEPWQQINPWQPVDWGIVPLLPLPAPLPAAGAAPHHVPDQQQQEEQLAAPAQSAASAVPAPQLSDAPVACAYGDVLRGQRCLQLLDVCVTALCKVMRASNTPLSQLRQLRLHMLGEVRLPAGGLPWLPLLTRLEFYLPDERNWGECYVIVLCYICYFLSVLLELELCEAALASCLMHSCCCVMHVCLARIECGWIWVRNPLASSADAWQVQLQRSAAFRLLLWFSCFRFCYHPADAAYNDDEDIALWQNQRSVTHISIRGTFHAGGFFAPGHVARARAAMPRLRCLLFANCGDLHSDRLQQVIDERLAPLVVLQACGAESSAAGKAAAAAGAGGPSGAPVAAVAAPAAGVVQGAGVAVDAGVGGEAAGGSAAAVEWLGEDAGLQADGADIGGGAGSSMAASSVAGSSSGGSDAGSSGLHHMDFEPLGTSYDAAHSAADSTQLSGVPQLVSEAVVKRMSAGAAAVGVQLQWMPAVQPWKAWLDDQAAWQ
jgi:hypothetical protein